MRKTLCLLLFAVSIASCASRISRQTIVLEYADFGPQVMAYRAIGPKRMSWAPDTPIQVGSGGIYVVVYRDVALADVEEAYRASELDNRDYRYLGYSEALNYLDVQITQNRLRKVTQRLEATRAQVVNKLGPASH